MKTVWKVTAGSLCTVAMIFSILLLYAFIEEVIMDECYTAFKRITYKYDYCEEIMLSNNISFQKFGIEGKKSKVVNLLTGKTTLKNAESIYTSNDGDSLAVFFKDNKRGYLNRFTGEVVIPAIYSKAWVFSEGLAAVVENRELKFIDRSGKTVISTRFAVSSRDEEYLFKNGYCLVREKESNMLGAIDTSGNWVIQPSFSSAKFIGDKIIVTKGNTEGLYRNNLEVLLPLEYSDIQINNYEGTILTRKGKDAPKLYDLDMNLLSDFVIDYITHLIYYTGEEKTQLDENGNEITEKEFKVANSNLYIASTPGSRNTYGLMSKNGKVITPPVYDNIKAIGPDRYLCSPHGIVIDDNGNEI